jgi:Flp pilus assembly pilin Flp
MDWVRTFYKDGSGASSVEYCILIGWITVMIISAVNIFGFAIHGL